MVLPVVLILRQFVSFVAKGSSLELCRAPSYSMSCPFSRLRSGAVPQCFLDFINLQSFWRLKASYWVESPSIWVCRVLPHTEIQVMCLWQECRRRDAAFLSLPPPRWQVIFLCAITCPLDHLTQGLSARLLHGKVTLFPFAIRRCWGEVLGNCVNIPSFITLCWFI